MYRAVYLSNLVDRIENRKQEEHKMMFKRKVSNLAVTVLSPIRKGYVTVQYHGSGKQYSFTREVFKSNFRKSR